MANFNLLFVIICGEKPEMGGFQLVGLEIPVHCSSSKLKGGRWEVGGTYELTSKILYIS